MLYDEKLKNPDKATLVNNKYRTLANKKVYAQLNSQLFTYCQMADLNMICYYVSRVCSAMEYV